MAVWEGAARRSVVVIEDDPSICDLLQLYLSRELYLVHKAGSGSEGVALVKSVLPSLVILDLMLPDISGFDVLKTVRTFSNVPVIVLTARDADQDKILGLELGADDYVVKPFSPQELVSRVRAVLRRSQQPGNSAARDRAADENERLVFGGLEIDVQARTVGVDGRQRSLTAKEFDLLLVLARQPRRVFTREELLGLVWGFTDYIDPSTVTVHIRRIREKIEEDASSPRYITTKWGVGYQFEP
jgi:two-component system, OmpR family, response regulator ResD